MKFLKYLVLIAFVSSFLVILQVNACGEPLKRICYYTSWGGVLPNPPDLCTHIIHSFASMENGMLSGVWSNPLKEIRQKNPEVKLMVAVGGWGFGVQRMTEMLKDESTRKKFVDDSVEFLKKFEFDGLDLDFECKFCFIEIFLITNSIFIS